MEVIIHLPDDIARIFAVILPAIRQYGRKAMQQNILAFWQLPCYFYGNLAMLFAVLLAIWQ
jgi:hypothetical protein